jgi:hypothetical protein
VLAIFFVPVFYVFVMRIFQRQRVAAEAALEPPAADVPEASAALPAESRA